MSQRLTDGRVQTEFRDEPVAVDLNLGHGPDIPARGCRADLIAAGLEAPPVMGGIPIPQVLEGYGDDSLTRLPRFEVDDGECLELVRCPSDLRIGDGDIELDDLPSGRLPRV